MAADASGDNVLLGGDSGLAGVYSISQAQIVRTLDPGSGAVTGGVWSGDRTIVATGTGIVKVYEGQREVASFRAHSGSVSALTLHPSGDILASVSEDKSYVLYDLESLRVLTQVFTDSGMYPPKAFSANVNGQIRTVFCTVSSRWASPRSWWK